MIVPGDLIGTLLNFWLVQLVLFFPLAIPPFLVMHFLMPKRVLARYWNSQYFQAWELALFSCFPSTFMRTVMLTGAMAFPRLGKKRKLTQLYLDVPNWYRIYAKVYIVAFFVYSGVFMAALIFFGIAAFVEGPRSA